MFNLWWINSCKLFCGWLDRDIQQYLHFWPSHVLLRLYSQYLLSFNVWQRKVVTWPISTHAKLFSRILLPNKNLHSTTYVREPSCCWTLLKADYGSSLVVFWQGLSIRSWASVAICKSCVKTQKSPWHYFHYWKTQSTKKVLFLLLFSKTTYVTPNL